MKMVRNPFYVYALKDPRTKPAKPFYIGKGTGTRAWEHELNIDDSEKGKTIKSIKDEGKDVICSIIADDLTEEQALKIEAELISAFGVKSRGGFLTNKVSPNPEKISTKSKINIPDGCYEKAQMALELIKASVMELILANPEGIRNSDVSKYLGLQSDYLGGSKDYLSFSILGILLKEQKISRIEKGKHILRK